MFKQLRETSVLVWRNKWEAIAGVAGMIGSIMTGAPLWLTIMLGLLTVILTFDLLVYIRKIFHLVRVKNMPIMVIVGRNDDLHRAMVKDVRTTVASSGFDEAMYTNEWQIEREDWVVRREHHLPEDPTSWHEITANFKKKLDHLDAKLNGERIFHIFFNGPVALSMGMGAVVGTAYRVVLYHYQQQQNAPSPYQAVIDLGHNIPPQVLKELVPLPDQETEQPPITETNQSAELDGQAEAEQQPQSKLKHCGIPDELTDDVYLSLHISAHSPHHAVEALAQEAGYSFIKVNNTYDGFLATDEDWLLVAREVIAIIRTIQDKCQRVHLYHNMPAAVAFAVGMGIGFQRPLTIYQYNPAGNPPSYYPAIHLEQLQR